MSEFLFPHSKLPAGRLRLRLAALGVAGGVALSSVLGVLGLQTLGVLSSDVRATVELPTVGDTLGINSDVKYNGLRVGRVIAVDPRARRGTGGHPTAEVLVEPRHADLIPAGVHARVLPGTLFGNEYVDLVTVPKSDGSAATVALGGSRSGHLTDGATIPADTSRKSMRLMDTFSATQRLLSAVDPSQWDRALSELASALDGRGAKIAEMIVDGSSFLGRWAELQPQVTADLELLATNSDTFAEIEPQLVRTLKDTRPLARTLIERQDELHDLLIGALRLLQGEKGFTEFLRANGADTARLLNATAANLEVFAERHPSFGLMLSRVPELLRNGAAAVKNGKIQMEGVIGLQSLDSYDDTDCPTYRGLVGACAGGNR